jgi:hypothetical protein
MKRDALEFYSQQGPMTEPGRYKALLDGLPKEPSSLAAVVQGLALYDVVAGEFYGVDVPKARLAELHLRRIEHRIERLLELDPRPLEIARPPERRVLRRCYQFVLFMVSMLRAKGVPARARCGFGAYFNPPKFEDHWVCEFWNSKEKSWILADPQFDRVWLGRLKLRHDVMDVPRTQFLTAAEAWRRCRAGEADPQLFGISFVDLFGFWFIASNLVRDLAALNKVEMLPWDVWGAHPRPGERIEADRLGFFDEVTRITLDPDATFHELRGRYDGDERLRVLRTVFNGLLERSEVVMGDKRSRAPRPTIVANATVAPKSGGTALSVRSHRRAGLL